MHELVSFIVVRKFPESRQYGIRENIQDVSGRKEGGQMLAFFLSLNSNKCSRYTEYNINSMAARKCGRKLPLVKHIM